MNMLTPHIIGSLSILNQFWFRKSFIFLGICFSTCTVIHPAESSSDSEFFKLVRKELLKNYPNPRARNHKVLYGMFENCFVRPMKLLSKVVEPSLPNPCAYQEDKKLKEVAEQACANQQTNSLDPYHFKHTLESMLILTNAYMQAYNASKKNSGSRSHLEKHVKSAIIPLQQCVQKAVAYQKRYPNTFDIINNLSHQIQGIDNSGKLIGEDSDTNTEDS